jgi:Sulfotransferase family
MKADELTGADRDNGGVSAPPLLILGVRRSGTTLLRVMLDRHSQLAIPDESYFIPQLAHRHRGPPDPDAFVDDLRRIPTLREWNVDPEDVRRRLPPGVSLGAAVAAVYETCAAAQGKERWGDKTPMYMQHLPLLHRLWPRGRYVHLVRDGRDVAMSFLGMPEGIVTRTWAHPRTAEDFACQWKTEVRAAQKLGREIGPEQFLEVRYERLAAEPETVLQQICDFAALPFEADMLDYTGTLDLSAKPHQKSLERPPTPGLRDWRRDMAAHDVGAFEDVAGDLLGELGYELTNPLAADRRPVRARIRLARYSGLTAAWNASGYALQRSPLWRRRHPPLS